MEGLISPRPARSPRIAPTPLQQPLLGGSPEVDLEPGRGPGLRTVFILLNRAGGAFPSDTCAFLCSPPLCTSCLFTLFSLSLPPACPIVFSRVGVQRKGRWGGLSGFWPRSGHPVAAHSVLLPRKSHGWRSLVGCSPWGRYESDTNEHLQFHFSLFTH